MCGCAQQHCFEEEKLHCGPASMLEVDRTADLFFFSLITEFISFVSLNPIHGPAVPAPPSTLAYFVADDCLALYK